MNGFQIFQIVCLCITVLGLTIAAIYLTKASIYQKSTSAFWDASRLYQEGKDDEANAAYANGKRLQAKGDRFASWLPD